VATVAAESLRGRWVTLAVGLFALVEASLAGAKGLRVVHAIAWRLPPFGLRRGGLAGLGFLVGATVLLAAGAGATWRAVRSPVPGLWVVCLLVLVYFAIWLGASRLLPHATGAPWTAMVSLLGGLYLLGWLVVASAMLNASRWEHRHQGRQAGPSS
jgi:hypothetical protein